MTKPKSTARKSQARKAASARSEKATPRRTAADTKAAVDEWMAALDHPQKSTIAALRKVIARADDSIEEGVKWNSPSFRAGEYFATINLRAKAGSPASPQAGAAAPVAVILHLGAKRRNGRQPEIADPAELLKWLSPDRAMMTFASLKGVQQNEQPIQAIVRAWLPFVPQ